MAGHFEKKSETSQDIPLSSMPDVIFILLIFFMVTTVMRENTIQVQTRLPEAESIEKIEQRRRISFIYIGPKKLGGGELGETQIQIADDLVQLPAITNIMYNKLLAQPELIVSLRVDEETDMGIITDVQQQLREAGTLRINYSSQQELE